MNKVGNKRLPVLSQAGSDGAGGYIYRVIKAARSVRRANPMALLSQVIANVSTSTEPQTLPIGSVIWFRGQTIEKRRSVVIEGPNQFGQQTVVTLDGEQASTVSGRSLRPYNSSSAIGYYLPDQPRILSAEAVATLIADYQKAIERKKAERLAENQRRADQTAAGIALIEAHAPTNAVAAILAIRKEDVSDSMTDYFAHRDVEHVLLGWSTHTRDNFDELRKVATRANFEPAQILIEAGKEAENREKWAGGSGYYLGLDWHKGWEIRKIVMGSLRSFYAMDLSSLEAFALSARKTEQQLTPEPPAAITEESASNLQILDYGEKAVVVTGGTKPIKDTLKEMGGRYNAWLTHPISGAKFAGWIFSRRHKETLTARFSN